MFVRFRDTGCRLQASRVATRREGKVVRHKYIAALGSAGLPLTIASRLDFWRELHPRFARLGNQLGAEDHAKILAAIHARVQWCRPMTSRLPA